MHDTTSFIIFFNILGLNKGCVSFDIDMYLTSYRILFIFLMFINLSIFF